MRLLLPLALAAAKSSTFVATVVAFVPPAPLAAAAASRATPLSRRGAETRVSGSGEGRALPPRDETFNPLAILRELEASPDVVDGSERYDRIGGSSGGIWRSLVLGFLPSTVITFQEGSKWIVQQEAAGNVFQSFPRTVVDILGEKALINLSVRPELHAIGRKPLSEALSPKAVLDLQSNLNAVVQKMVLRLEGFAESGQEVVMQDELTDFTLESIVGVFFGDYATPEFMGDVKKYMPDIVKGLFSFPLRFPSPLNELPVFAYGKSMDARDAFSGIIRRVLDERRADFSSLGQGSTSTGEKSAGVLDKLVEIQEREKDSDRGQEGAFDDDFIVDNVILSLFAGTDTTSVTLTRILQLLATADDGKEIVASLLRELRNEATSDDDELDDTTKTGKGGASRQGVLSAFPLLDAVILEAFRFHPTVPAVFRKARKDVTYNGYLIPEGESINWNLIHEMRASSLYPEPKKFCPFRFLHGDKGKDTETAASASPGGATAEQPIPQMFGLGRHMCPGRELAKLEMITFLKAFLTKFDYELVEGQSLKGVLPSNGPRDKLRLVLKAKSAP